MSSVMVLGSNSPNTLDSWLSMSLTRNLKQNGYDVEYRELSFPFSGSVDDKLKALEELDQFVPLPKANCRIIATAFPSYLVSRPQKTIWLSSQYEPYAELWGTELGRLSYSPKMEELRRAIFRKEQQEFSRSKLYSCTHAKQNWLRASFCIRSDVLYPPISDAADSGQTENFFLCLPTTSSERLDLLFLALKLVHQFVRLTVAVPATVFDCENLRLRAEGLGVGDRVDIVCLEDEDNIANLISRALGFVDTTYLALYPRFVLQAMARGKPVVLFDDNRVCREFVADHENGFVSAVSAQSLGDILNLIVGDKTLSSAVGVAARATVENVLNRGDWQTVFNALGVEK